MKKMILFLIVTFASASPLNSEYRNFISEIREPVQVLKDRFPDGIKYSLYTSEHYLKPFGINIQKVVKEFYNNHSLSGKIDSDIKEVYGNASSFEEARLIYSKKVVEFTKRLNDTKESIGNEDLGGFLLGLASASVSNDDASSQKYRLRKAFNRLIDSLEKLENNVRSVMR